MTSNGMSQDQRHCPACGIPGTGRFCSECGAALADGGAVVGRALRDDAVDVIGFDRRLIATFRDLLIHPVRIVGAHMAGDRSRYLPPLRLFVAPPHVGGTLHVHPLGAPSLRRMGVSFHQLIVALPLYLYLGVVFFAQYRPATPLRTTGGFAIFAVADFIVSVVISTVLFALVYLSVLLF